MDTFIKYHISNISKYNSISKVYNYLKGLGYKCGKNILLNFLKFVQDVFFIFTCEIFSFSIRNRMQYPKKVYLVDNGIAKAYGKEGIDWRMENNVFIELFRRSDAFNNFQVFYWKEYGKRNGEEVDFVITKGLEIKELIQVTYANSIDEINKREFKGLLKASKELKCNNLSIITWDFEDKIKVENKIIKCIPLWKWNLIF